VIAKGVVKGVIIVIIAPDPILTGHGLMQRAGADIIPVRTAPAPGRHVDADKTWIYGRKNIMPESKAFHGSGAIILDENITRFYQFLENFFAFRFVYIYAAA
jgi:hypothetical protein